MSEPVFQLKNVSKAFASATNSHGIRALEDVSLRIEAGEQVALIGPSGAGKSTLLGLLNGSLAPSRGEVQVLGRSMGDLAPAAARAVQRRIATIYQQHHLVDNLRVAHNVNCGHLGRWSTWKALLSLLLWPQEVERAHAALEQVGIGGTLWERTSDLSVGQQQRVAIARALVQEPEAMLADEPVASLDPERARAVLELLCRLGRETGKTLLVSLHQVDQARSHFQRAIALRSGRVVFDGSINDLSPDSISDLYRLEEPGVGTATDFSPLMAAVPAQ